MVKIDDDGDDDDDEVDDDALMCLAWSQGK